VDSWRAWRSRRVRGAPQRGGEDIAIPLARPRVPRLSRPDSETRRALLIPEPVSFSPVFDTGVISSVCSFAKCLPQLPLWLDSPRTRHMSAATRTNLTGGYQPALVRPQLGQVAGERPVLVGREV